LAHGNKYNTWIKSLPNLTQKIWYMLAVLLRPFRQIETNALELGLVMEVIRVSWLGGVATQEIYNHYEGSSNCKY
jgi:hypothetical protein